MIAHRHREHRDHRAGADIDESNNSTSGHIEVLCPDLELDKTADPVSAGDDGRAPGGHEPR